jgi:hypothetical protein
MYNCKVFTIERVSVTAKMLKRNLQLKRKVLGLDKEFSMKCIEKTLTAPENSMATFPLLAHLDFVILYFTRLAAC